MTGLCGVVGPGSHHVEAVAPGLEWTGEEHTTTFEGDRLSVHGSFTSPGEADQPVAIGEGDTLLWVWGSVFGFDSPEGYRPRDPLEGSLAAYCARRYERHGPSFVAGLNGDFVGVVYDREAGTVSVFTDRLALRDTYYARPDEETLVFSTAIQSLSRHPRVTPAFDADYVAEYFSCAFRTFGTRTPLAGTALFPPGAVTTVETDTLATDADRYWVPRYDPVDRSFSSLVEEFAGRFRAAVTERVHPERDYGLLLSGGGDSRLVLAALDSDRRDAVTAYHMTGWMSREARTARRAARTAGVDLEWLRRGRDYHERAARRNPRLSNFVGRFEQAHAEGFMEEVRGDVDAMMTATFADSNFKGYSFPTYSLPLGPLGSVSLPLQKPMDSIDRYVDFWFEGPPGYLASSVDARSVLEREIRPTDDGVVHHGVEYDSPRELFVCGALTPRTNGTVLFMLQSLRQHVPAWSPYVDNRLVDLYLSIPVEQYVRRNLVYSAMKRLDPDLATVPTASTGLPVEYPYPAHYLGEHVFGFLYKFTSYDEGPEPHQWSGPWPDLPTVVREQSFVREAIERNERAIRELPFLDWEGAVECYEDHLDGANNHDELYGLLTLLEMPVTRRVVEASTD